MIVILMQGINIFRMKKIISTTCFLLLFTASIWAQLNVVFIESDDQSNQAVGSYGNPTMVTPNIDQLSKEGVSFMNAYNMGCWSPAVCIPSRTMLFYGQSLWNSAKITKENSPKSFVETLRENGYSTYITGKWHAMGKPVGEVFEEVGSIQPGQLKTYNTDKGHVTDITGNEAVEYISTYNKKQPFLLYVAFNAPHVPRQTSQNYYDLYPTNTMKLPPSVVDRSPLNKNVKYQYAPDPLSEKTMRERVQQNSAMVTHMDERIGDILKALKEKGIYENTIIIFTSDHGINFGENGVAGKVCLYEPSVTAPLIIKAPSIQSNTKVNERVYLQDIHPTIFDLLKISSSEKIVFKNLMPLINKTGSARKSIYLAMFDDQRGIISGKDKLIIYPKTGDLELYDLEKDPWETTNLFSSKKKNATLKMLLNEMKIAQLEAEDQVDLSAIYQKYLN